MKRALALGVDVRFVTVAPENPGPGLVSTAGLLVQPDDVRRVIIEKGRLVDASGADLFLAWSECPEAAWTPALEGRPPVRAVGVSCLVRDSSDAAVARERLWASLTSSTDGLVDRWFNRPAGRVLSRILIHAPVTPNQVTLFATVLGLIAAVLFADGTHRAVIWGAVLFQLSALIDCIDGDVARMMFRESRIGKWLDLIADQVVHAAVFAGVAVGLHRINPDGPAVWLGVAAVTGAVLSFVVVLRGMRLSRPDRKSLADKLVEGATNRDFSVLVLLLAVFDRLIVFLWLAAIGSHVFWMLALALQRAGAASSAVSTRVSPENSRASTMDEE